MTVQLATLPNGLRIATDSYDTVETAAVIVTVEAGSRHDAPELNGTAHFLEHMAFKGTTSRTTEQIIGEIESRGGHINAGTGKDITQYYANVLKEDVGVAIDVLADIVCNPTFPEDEFEREKGVILQEIAEIEDDHYDWLGDRLLEVSLNGGLGLPGTGSAKTVGRIDVNHLKGFARFNHHPGKIVVTAAGNIDHDDFVRQASNAFPMTGNVYFGQSQSAFSYMTGNHYLATDDSEQAHIRIAWPSFGLGHDDLYAAALLSTILGGCSSSRLFREVRDKRGLCYSIGFGVSPWRDAGLFMFGLSCGAESADEAIRVSAEELLRITYGLTHTELDTAKRITKADLLMGMESTHGRASKMSHHVAIHGSAFDVHEEVAKFEAVDHAGIQRAITRMFSARPSIAVYGPSPVTGIDIARMLD